jgi:hypothetical protein
VYCQPPPGKSTKARVVVRKESITEHAAPSLLAMVCSRRVASSYVGGPDGKHQRRPRPALPRNLCTRSCGGPEGKASREHAAPSLPAWFARGGQRHPTWVVRTENISGGHDSHYQETSVQGRVVVRKEALREHAAPSLLTWLSRGGSCHATTGETQQSTWVVRKGNLSRGDDSHVQETSVQGRVVLPKGNTSGGDDSFAPGNLSTRSCVDPEDHVGG